MRKNKTTQITKGHDPYLDITPLSGYCRERGWQVISEVVTIVLPKGKELEQFKQDIRAGKILVVDDKENR